jgi:hypothetical protein
MDDVVCKRVRDSITVFDAGKGRVSAPTIAPLSATVTSPSVITGALPSGWMSSSSFGALWSALRVCCLIVYGTLSSSCDTKHSSDGRLWPWERGHVRGATARAASASRSGGARRERSGRSYLLEPGEVLFTIKEGAQLLYDIHHGLL